MRIILTGATGFLGSHLARGLLAAGHGVTATVRSSSSFERIDDLSGMIRFVDTDRDGMEDLFTGTELPGAVIHTATYYGREGSEADRVFDANVNFPSELAQKAAGHGIPVFINTDTFYPADYPVLPEYARTKKQFAKEGKSLFLGQGRTFINLRMQHLYGPGDGKRKFIPSLIRSCLENTPRIQLTDGRQKRDFIYVADAVQAYLCLLERAGDLPEGSHQFDLGTGTSTSVRELAEIIREQTGSKSSLLFGALSRDESEIMDSVADTGGLMKLGWRPQVSLEEGIALTVDCYSTGGEGRER